MTIVFTPPIGLKDKNTYPDKRTGDGFRNDMQGLLDQIKDQVNAAMAFKGVLLRKNTVQSVPNNVITFINWDIAEYDTTGFFSATKPTRITIPSGISKVVLKGNSSWAVTTTGQKYITIYKNGLEGYGLPMTRLPQGDSTRANQNICSAVIPVVAGDYFEFVGYQGSGGALDFFNNFQSWFALEVVE